MKNQATQTSEFNLNIGDSVNDSVITKLSESSVWFGEKRFLKSSFKNKKMDIMFKESPDANINWTNPKEVDAYYLTFNQWTGVVRMGDTKHSQLLEVKDNKIFFEGEYYLPYYSHHINLPEKKFLKDGYIWGYCLKMHNSFYSHQNTNTVNVFYIEKEVSKTEYEYGVTKEANYKKYIDKKITVLEYFKLIDFNRINSKDLDLLKENFIQLFEGSIFPYSTNKVDFRMGDFKRMCFYHRNRSGYLSIDNGYKGAQPFGNNYYIILIGNPYFTNVCSAQSRCEGKEITFDKKMLDTLSLRIVKAFDHAIEQNYTLHH